MYVCILHDILFQAKGVLNVNKLPSVLILKILNMKIKIAGYYNVTNSVS